MAITAKLDVNANEIVPSLQDFFKAILALDEIQSLLVPQQLPMKKMVMPTLVTDPDHLNGADPLAPAFPINAAKILSRLTRKPANAVIAAVLRPCEIRAFVELVKLKQGSTDDVIIIGVDCLGAYQNTDYLQLQENQTPEEKAAYYAGALRGNATVESGLELAPACLACEHPVAENADIVIGLYGMDISQYLLVQSHTESGDRILKQTGLSVTETPKARRDAIASVVARRAAYRKEMFAKTHDATADLEKMATYFATCVNCYNCRVACPVCYCKECVFVTDVFNHDPSQYLQWANRKGMIKMPTDTLFYHLTRLAHMGTACVGCGQCSNACPNDIPVMELFKMVGQKSQQAFDYEAGRSPEEPPPLSIFREDEFTDIVGIAN